MCFADKAEEIAELMQQINGVKDIKVEQIAGQPYLIIDIDRQKIARYGINVADVQEIITTAIGGKVATHVYEGERRFQLDPEIPGTGNVTASGRSGEFG